MGEEEGDPEHPKGEGRQRVCSQPGEPGPMRDALHTLRAQAWPLVAQSLGFITLLRAGSYAGSCLSQILRTASLSP